MSSIRFISEELTADFCSPEGPEWGQFLAIPENMEQYPVSQLPLRNQINQEFLTTGIIVRSGNQDLGRIAIYDNPNLGGKDQKTGILGNYECINSQEVADILLSTAEQYVRKQGAKRIIGPMNGSTWDQYRFTVHPDRPPFFTEQIQPAYYLNQWEKAGFQSIGEYSSALDTEMIPDQRVARGHSLMKKRGIRIRPIELDRYEEELERLYDLCLLGFANNYLYSPISKRAFFEKYLPAKPAIDPRWVLIAENAQGDPGAFIFCLPNHWSQDSRQLIIKTLVRHPDRIWAGIGAVLSGIVTNQAKEEGVDSIIHALMYQGGGGKSVSARFNGQIIQTYRLYGKDCQ